MKKGLIIFHIDGVSFERFQHAIKRDCLPYIAQYMREKQYTVQRYRCGLPSTTPHCQAGILYGDSSNIPAYRWWDKQSNILVSFGRRTSFQNVSQKYFKHHKPLIINGACIAACFSAGAKEAITLSHEEKKTESSIEIDTFLLLHWLKNPLRIATWFIRTSAVLFTSFIQFLKVILSGKSFAFGPFMDYIINEIFIHYATVFAVEAAMEKDFPIIFAGLYTYDEISHALGPQNSLSNKALLRIDSTIKYIGTRATQKKRSYEILLLSDHGNIRTIPFQKFANESLAEKLARLLPEYTFEQVPGKQSKGVASTRKHILLVLSGQLANCYITDIPQRVSYKEMKKNYQSFISVLAHMNEIAFLLLKENDEDVILVKDTVLKIRSSKLDAATYQFLKQFDDPDIVARQLRLLNNSETAGDVILFGAFKNDAQISFENHAGSHSGLGGEQTFPFIMTKNEWDIDVSKMFFSDQLYTKLVLLKEKLEVDR